MGRIVTRQATARVTRYTISFSRHKRLEIALRRFKTQRMHRSKRRRQLVLPSGMTYYREIALSWQSRKRKKQALRASRWALAPSAGVVLGLSGLIYFGLNLKAPMAVTLSPSHTTASLVSVKVLKAPKTLPASVPVAIHIPKIEVDTTITPTGLQDNGTIAMPDSFDTVDWYSGSPTPGELGPSVLVGHLDRVGGIAVFWRLRELLPGDTITIDRQDGSTATFKVLALQEYAQDQFPTSAVYGDITYAGLRLVTCGGTFNEETHHYSDNLVVYAALQ